MTHGAKAGTQIMFLIEKGVLFGIVQIGIVSK